MYINIELLLHMWVFYEKEKHITTFLILSHECHKKKGVQDKIEAEINQIKFLLYVYYID